MDEVKKRLKECYLQLKREHGWSEDQMALNMKSSIDHLEHMEEGQEKNKEWETFWLKVDEDMFTYVMKDRIEEIIEEKLNQEFPSEVEQEMMKMLTVMRR